MFRLQSLAALLLAALSFAAPAALRAADDAGPASGLQGKIEGRSYVSPTGTFKVTIPVLPELGGEINDTPSVVTFEDRFNTHISIAAFAHDAMQRWELSTRGLSEYLGYFVSNFLLGDFRQSFPGSRIESAKFGPVPGVPDGALVAYLLIPGGSMFGEKALQLGADGQPPVAKRGNLLFVKSGHTFIVSIELAEKVTEGKLYNKTTAQEDEILLKRLLDVLGKIEFAKPPAVTPAADAKK